MPKTILITGATDGIGLATARTLVGQGHTVLLHGRSADKLARVAATLQALPGAGRVHEYVADLSHWAEVDALIKAVCAQHTRLGVLINNAGVYRTPEPRTADGLDVRFVVNTLAPYRLTHGWLALLGAGSRVVNLSSAAQAPVDLGALAGQSRLADMAAYAQSKLALTMWSHHLAQSMGPNGPVVVAVNPGSLLATKMVREGFGVAGADVGIGADILVRAALHEDFANASGRYFDNDSGQFAPGHPDASDPQKTAALVRAMDALLRERQHSRGPGAAA